MLGWSGEEGTKKLQSYWRVGRLLVLGSHRSWAILSRFWRPAPEGPGGE
jgi:hypothetical protein